ncbi:MAG: orotate phosphoribosyltransferase [Bacillota bacterium]
MNEDIIKLLKKSGAIMEGHFLLTSGRHSSLFLQCSQLMQYPEYAELICSRMAEPFKNERIEAVIGPAMGGIIMAYETARSLGARALFAERSDSGMILRRGFSIKPGEKVLVVEDAVTTGGSVQKVLDMLHLLKAEVIAVSILVDRTAGRLDFGLPLKSLLSMEIESYEADNCPLCLKGIPIQRPKG